MKNQCLFIVILCAMMFMAAKCDTTQDAGPGAEEQKACLQQCQEERDRIERDYDNCLATALESLRGAITGCLQRPPGESLQCVQDAFARYEQDVAVCKSTRDTARRNNLGCEARCHLTDPMPTK